MLFVCYPKCSTCKKAQKWLDESGAEYTLRDIKTDNPTAEELKVWWEKSGLPLKRFFNTSGNIYKAHVNEYIICKTHLLISSCNFLLFDPGLLFFLKMPLKFILYSNTFQSLLSTSPLTSYPI